MPNPTVSPGTADERRARRALPLAAALGGLLTLASGRDDAGGKFLIAFVLIAALAGVLGAIAFWLARAAVDRRRARAAPSVDGLAAARPTAAPPIAVLTAVVVCGGVLGGAGVVVTAHARDAGALRASSTNILADASRALDANISAASRVAAADGGEPLDTALLHSLVPEPLRHDATFLASLERDSTAARARCARAATARAPRTTAAAMDEMGCLVREMEREYPVRTARDSARDSVRRDVLLAYRDSTWARENGAYAESLKLRRTP